MKISVLGMGGVGYSVANILGAAEHDVIGLDINPEVLENPRTDKGTKRFIERYRKTISKHLVLTTDYKDTKGSDMAISLVNTGFSVNESLSLGTLTVGNLTKRNASMPPISFLLLTSS